MKKWSVLFLMCLLVFSCKGVLGDNSKKDIYAVRIYFEDAGFEVADFAKLFGTFVGAHTGFRAKINGCPLRVYKFEPYTSEAKKIFSEVKEKSTLTIEGKTVPVIVNGSFALYIEDEGHPEKNKIVKTFKKF